MKKIIALILILALAFSMTACKKTEDPKKETGKKNEEVVDPVKQAAYDQALALVNEGKFAEAYAAFESLGDFKDSKDMLARFRYLPTSMVYTSVYESDGETETEGATSTTVLNDRGLPTTITMTYTDGDLDIYYFTYNEAGSVVKVVNYWNEDLYTVEYSYDSSYNIIEEISTSGNGTSITTYKYDSRGNMTEEKYIANDGSTTVYTWVYDSQNRITKKTESYGEKTTYVYEYEYDSNGNEIKCEYSYPQRCPWRGEPCHNDQYPGNAGQTQSQRG